MIGSLSRPLMAGKNGMKTLILFALLLQTPRGFFYSEVALRRVVDGDTVQLDLQVAPKLWYQDQPCRLLRIDTPERNTAEGKEARVALIDFLRGKKLTAMVRRTRDRYGRFLIELTADGENVSDWLARQGYKKLP